MTKGLILAPLAIVALAASANSQTRVDQKTVVFVGTAGPAFMAAQELARTLSEITGRAIRCAPPGDSLPENAIVVGPASIVRKYLPDLNPDQFGNEEFVLKTVGSRLFIIGGKPRGTMYGVYRFLQDYCGVRWWAPWATTIPSNPKLVIPKLDRREKPAFESRDPYWRHAIDGAWARHNYSNSQFAQIDDEHGGKLRYQGFVHTFYGFVPPSMIDVHPEWFSLINGKRVNRDAQLCTTNPELRDHIVAEVRKLLRENPGVNILSISQNDCYNPCQCDKCQALARAEGSESAPVLALANYVAEKIEKDYPNVAIDTLAYQYTRHAPKTMRPRANVIVRLCSIECNFAKPLDDVSNQSFANDIKDWSRLTNRLYIWDYVTDFPHYIQPFPNYDVLGPNLRFFAANGVKGVFEEGAYESCGAEMAELRAWVLAQQMWNPKLDDRKLADEFLAGYYGAASKPIRRYLDLMAAKAAGSNMTIWSNTNSPFLDYGTMLAAERLWQQAETAVSMNRELLRRVRVSHLPVRYVWLRRWEEFRRLAMKNRDRWPMSDSRRKIADEWYAVAATPGPAGWTPITHLREGDASGPRAFVAPFDVDPPEPTLFTLPERGKSPKLPADLRLPANAQVVDAQDNLARLWQDGVGAELRPDPAASDGIACWMPGSHHEWAFQLPYPAEVRKGRWHVYVVARVEASGPADQIAFSAGIYDGANRRELITQIYSLGQASKQYKTYDLGVFEAGEGHFIWVAPPANSFVRSVWVDRAIFVKE